RADLLLSMQPLLHQYGVDLYVSGHDHCYQRFEPSEDADTVLVVSGGGGKSLYATKPHPRLAKANSAFHWCSVVADRDAMTLEAHGLDGELLDRVAIARAAGARLARIRAAAPARAA